MYTLHSWVLRIRRFYALFCMVPAKWSYEQCKAVTDVTLLQLYVFPKFSLHFLTMEIY
jgi:hypothetical protein